MLLLALKILHPGRVHLLRGNHEDEHVNALYGFKEEATRCAEGLVVWQQVNALFEMMPVAALVDGAVLCLHGGLGLRCTRSTSSRGCRAPPRSTCARAASAVCSMTSRRTRRTATASRA